MAKVMDKEQIWDHNAGALIYGSPHDFTEEERNQLEVRYPGLHATAVDLMANPGWKTGKVCPANFGSDEKPAWVIFVNIEESGKPSYSGVRTCLQKIAKKFKDEAGTEHQAVSDQLKIKHFAMGRLGCRSPGSGIHIGILDSVVAGSEEEKIFVDIYRGGV